MGRFSGSHTFTAEYAGDFSQSSEGVQISSCPGRTQELPANQRAPNASTNFRSRNHKTLQTQKHLNMICKQNTCDTTAGKMLEESVLHAAGCEGLGLFRTADNAMLGCGMPLHEQAFFNIVVQCALPHYVLVWTSTMQS